MWRRTPSSVGRAQLADLDRRVNARRAINAYYRAALGDLDGWSFMPEANFGRPTCWLTCALVGSRRRRDSLLERLAAADIEARPVWKPMHMQPVFQDCKMIGGGLSRRLFEEGLCLPSGTAMSDAIVREIADVVASVASS